MRLEDSFRIKVPIWDAWDFISNPEKFGSCIPGCEQVRTIDQKTFECTLKQKIAGLSLRFKLTVSLLEVNPPHHLESIVKGEYMSKAGTITQRNLMELKELGDQETSIHYASDFSITGKLALFGEKGIQTKAKRLGEEFIRALKGTIESSAPSDL